MHWRRSGKGSEIGKTFEELARIFDKVVYNDKLHLFCFDTCHTNDSGYDVVHDFDGVINEFDHIIGKDRIAVFHINDSKNVRGAAKDRHANIGFGELGFDAINYIVHHPDFINVPKILETPYIPSPLQKRRNLTLHIAMKLKCCETIYLTLICHNVSSQTTNHNSLL